MHSSHDSAPLVELGAGISPHVPAIQQPEAIDRLLQSFAVATNHLLTFSTEQESVQAALAAL
ncbi:hypothetical protein IQ225_14175, partial [Synechocystis salina LEGE 06155]|nr:hypothetical protein [Synechocystis salina LEGE 06155]